MVEMFVRARRLPEAIRYFKRYVQTVEGRVPTTPNQLQHRHHHYHQEQQDHHQQRGRGRGEGEGEEREKEALSSSSSSSHLQPTTPTTGSMRASPAVFGAMVRGFTQAQKFNEAFRLMRVMERRGMKLSQVCCRLFIRSFIRS